MKINKKIILIFVLTLVVIVGVLFIKYFYEKDIKNKDDLLMIQNYLNSKYNMNLKIKEYNYYDNGDLGINAGKHYTFTFEPIENFEINAKLDYYLLEKENLNHLILNITNIDIASKLKNYVEENSNLKCKVTECRKVEVENDDDYYYFRVELDNEFIYWIMGEIYDLENLENVSGLSISTSLIEKYELQNNDKIDFKSLLNYIKK